MKSRQSDRIHVQSVREEDSFLSLRIIPEWFIVIFLINILLRIVKETVFMRINIKTIWLVDLPNKG